MTSDKTERFEDRLLSTLKEEVVRNASRLNAAEKGASARRRLITLPRVGVAVAGGAAATAGLLMVPGLTASPAYAVEEKPGGGVQVTVDDMSFDREQQEALAAELEDAGVHVEIRNPEPGTTCARDDRYSTSTTLMPTKVVDGEEEMEALGVSWYSEESDRSRGADALEDLTRIDLTGDHSLVIENVVPNEGMRHRPTFLPVKGEPPACDPVPYDAHWRIDE